MRAKKKGYEKTAQTDLASKIWEDYKNGINFQSAMGFSKDFPVYEEFKAGRQWPQVTEKTKSLPRPVFNIVSMFVANKKSSVLNNNVKMIFRPAETGDNTAGDDVSQRIRHKTVLASERYTDFANNLWYELEQDSLNDEVVEDAATNGTGIFHYYWDNAITGGAIRPYTGALRGESIDALNFFVSNPQERDIQKQEWIIISSRATVDSVRKLAKDNGVSDELIKLIVADNDTNAEGYETAKREQKGTDKVTVLTKYYKKKGIVYFVKSTKSVVITKEICLTPGYKEDSVGYAIKRYPIAVFSWKTRKKCMFGIGEVEGIIPNQKAINFGMAMLVLSSQDTGWPKMLVKPGALRQKVTNRPGEILTDYNTSGDGIKYLQAAPFNYGAMQLIDKIFELSRATSGVTEVATGEALGANMAASAIIALQNQAKLPIDNIQKSFYRVIREVGLIWECFFKTFYSEERIVVKEAASDKHIVEGFKGTDYSDVEFDLRIDVGASSIYSESLGQATLDKMYEKGDIDVDMYIELAPDNVMPFKEMLKELREKRKQEAQAMPQVPQMQMGGLPNGMSNMQGAGLNL